MRKQGLLHAELSRILTAMGHTDLIVIADAGLPVPAGVPCIDLAVVPGVPGFFDVLRPVLAELKVEEATVAAELSPLAKELIDDLAGTEFPVHTVAHEEFKRLSARAKAVVRTGECTPYHNIILSAGVTF